MTFIYIYELDPYFLEIYMYIYRMCICTSFVKALDYFRKLSSDRQTNRQTDTTEIIYHAVKRVVNNLSNVM